MIERVAQAMEVRARAGLYHGEPPWRALARAAVKAMRDVDSGTPEILRRGKKALYSCSSDPELEDARGCWQEMIDAALEEDS